MAILRVNATRTGQVLSAEGGTGWAAALDAALGQVPPGAPVTVLVHGYRFSWRRAGGTRETCAQSLLYCADEIAPSARLRPARADWPARLGFTETGRGEGLCIAFGWDARRGRLRSLLMRGANDFSLVYRGAEGAGRGLAQVLGRVAALRPDLRPGLFTHSLGARVALAAVRCRPDLALGRVVMLAAAEYAGEARATLDAQRRAGGTAEFLNATSRANGLYDLLFAVFAPGPARMGDRPLGWTGLGAPHPRWRDLRLDCPRTLAWLDARSPAPIRRPPRFSHWHFYADPGAMTLWRAVVRCEPGFEALPAPQIEAPRRLWPGLPHALARPAAAMAPETAHLAPT